MKNLIPQHLFEMAKYSETDMIQKMSDVLDVIYTYDYADLINENYGETIKYLKNTYGNNSVTIHSKPLFRSHSIPNLFDLYKKDKFISILKIILEHGHYYFTDIFTIFYISYKEDNEVKINKFNCGVMDFDVFKINYANENRYLQIKFMFKDSNKRVFDRFYKELNTEMEKTELFYRNND